MSDSAGDENALDNRMPVPPGLGVYEVHMFDYHSASHLPDKQLHMRYSVWCGGHKPAWL